MAIENIEQVRKNILEQLSKYPEEQVREIREQIENANEEELEEFVLNAQNNSNKEGKCVFCEIISGNIQSIKLYEDKDILAVMDILPATKGQIIIFPKKHNQFIQDVEDLVLNKIFYLIKNISPILVKTLNPMGISIYIPQGQLAGQSIPHFSINLIPRYENDNKDVVFSWKKEKKDFSELNELADKIKQNSKELFKKLQNVQLENNIISQPKEKIEEKKENQEEKNQEEKIEKPLPILKRKIPN